MSQFFPPSSFLKTFVGLPRRRDTRVRRAHTAERVLAAQRARNAREELRNRVERDALYFPFR